MLPTDCALYPIFLEWCDAEAAAKRPLNPNNDDSDPAYIEAEQNAHAALIALLCKPTNCLHGIALKLKIACRYEDYAESALDDDNRYIGPRAVIAALIDLENLMIEHGCS